jgi:hypothetical protein
MKTIQIPGAKVDDVGSLWYDLLKKGFDVESVGSSGEATTLYLADDEDKNPQPIVESWVGKPLQTMSRSAVQKRRAEVLDMVDNARKARVERAAQRAQEEAERKALGKPELKISATGQPGMLGIVEALSNGIDSHTVLIQKMDPEGKLVEGDDELSVTVSHKVPISNASPKLDGGMAMIQVGPSSAVGDFTIEVKGGGMKAVKLALRFVKQRTDQPSTPPPPLEKNGGIMSVVKKLLGI